MDITNTDDLIEGVISIIDYLSAKGDDFYVSLELAHQLHDELIETIPEDE